MLIKITALSVLAASTPLYLLNTEDPTAFGPQKPGAVRRADPATLDYEQLKARLKAAAEENRRLKAELEESLDLIEQSTQRERRNCTPSRRMLSHYQFMNRHGHDDRAERILERVVKERGDDASHLESFARDLMTNKETMGQFDEMALALAQRLATKVRPGEKHVRAFDTMALAHFLNGDAEQAIAMQRVAVENKSNSEYRRRLRTYEAALQMVVPSASLLIQDPDQDQ